MRTSSLSMDTARNARFIKKFNKISSSVVIKPGSFGMKAAVMGAVSLILSDVVNFNHEAQTA